MHTPNIPETVEAAIAAALPTEAPNIDATIDASIRATLAAVPTPAEANTPVAVPTLTPPPSLAAIIQQVRPAVVRIENTQGSGSGVIIETTGQTGIVLTNFHVIERGDPIYVTVNDSKRFLATIRGVDRTRDLAILNICCGAFHSVDFANAANVQPGSTVLSMGYPLGFPGEASSTTGIVSATRYDSAESRWVIQSDAAINPGNSGGPMFLLTGEVIGINTFKEFFSADGRPTEGLGFAVSETTIRNQLLSLKSGSYRVSPTPTPRPVLTPTPRPTSTPFVYDDYGDNRFTAATAYLTLANSPIIFTGELETRRDIDTFSFQGSPGESFVVNANYLLRGSIVTAIGHPKLVLYRVTPSSPLAIDDRAGDLFYSVVDGGTMFLDVSSYNSKLTSGYQIVVHRIR